jgi:hypothetical protein
MPEQTDSTQGSCLGPGIIVGLIVIGIVVAVSLGISARNPSDGPPLSELTKAMERRLGLLPAAGTKPTGVAVALLVDTSLSMYDPVASVKEPQRKKIEIVRDAAQRAMEQFATFARKHPELPLEVGVYEFSVVNQHTPCRPVVGLGPLNLPAAKAAIRDLKEPGETLGTPVGDAMLEGYCDLRRSLLPRLHLLLLTDGESNRGLPPEIVAKHLAALPPSQKPQIYCIAFDVETAKFDALKEEGALVFSAANAEELRQAFDSILTGKILVEEPTSPGEAPAPASPKE